MINIPFSRNAEVYILPTFSADVMLRTMVKHQLTEILVVPMMLSGLVQASKTSNNQCSRLRRIASGAAPLPKTMLDAVEGAFPGRGYRQGE